MEAADVRIRCTTCHTVEELIGRRSEQRCWVCGVRLPGDVGPAQEPARATATAELTAVQQDLFPVVPEARAAQLRRAWFDVVMPALSRSCPGADESLPFASARLWPSGELRVRVPQASPLPRQVQTEMRREIRRLLREVVGTDIDVRTSFAGSVVVRPLGRSAPLDVVRPGDPPTSQWPVFERELRLVIGSVGVRLRGVLSAAVPAGFSRDSMWLAFPDEAALLAVDATFGARQALNHAVELCNPHCQVVMYVDSSAATSAPGLGGDAELHSYTVAGRSA